MKYKLWHKIDKKLDIVWSKLIGLDNSTRVGLVLLFLHRSQCCFWFFDYAEYFQTFGNGGLWNSGDFIGSWLFLY